MNEGDLKQVREAHAELDREIESRIGLDEDIHRLRSEYRKLNDILVRGNPEALRLREKIAEIEERISRTKRELRDSRSLRTPDFSMIPVVDPVVLEKGGAVLPGTIGEARGGSSPDLVYFRTHTEMMQRGPVQTGTWVNGVNDWWGFTGCELETSGDEVKTLIITQTWSGVLDRSNHYLMSNRINRNLKLSFRYEMDGTLAGYPDFGGGILIEYEPGFSGDWRMNQSPATTIMEKTTYFREESGQLSFSLFMPFQNCPHIFLIGNRVRQPEPVRYYVRYMLYFSISSSSGGYVKIGNLSFGYTSTDRDRDIWFENLGPALQ
jgi:hypothetical protein